MTTYAVKNPIANVIEKSELLITTLLIVNIKKKEEKEKLSKAVCW